MHDLTHRIEARVIAQRAAQDKATRVISATKPIFPSNGDWHKCAGVVHAEENGQAHPGREPSADGLILAYLIWGKYPNEKTKELLKIWIETKCRPSHDFRIITERIEKFYKAAEANQPDPNRPGKIHGIYSPCGFLMKYGHCDSAVCSVIRKRGVIP